MSNILIVDDQPHIMELFSQELMDEGHKVLSARDTDSFMNSISDSKPDVVLLDLYFNGFEGWDMLRYIKRKDPKIPVLITTAYDNYRDDPRLSQADGYFVKNFTDLDKLKKMISGILDRANIHHPE